MQLSDDSIINGVISPLLSGNSHLSYSSLKAFKENPRAFIDYKLRKREQTDAMVFGSMVHCLVLEPQLFDERYFFLNDTDIFNEIGGASPRSTKAYREWKATEMQKAGDKIVISLEDYNHAQAISNNIIFNDASRKVMNMGKQHEVPIEWEYMNFKFKGFIDGIGENAIFDIKTCSDADPRKFKYVIHDMSYSLQAAMYLHGAGVDVPYYIIAVDKSGGVSVHNLGKRLLEKAAKEYEQLMIKFGECILMDGFYRNYDFWSGKHDGIYIVE